MSILVQVETDLAKVGHAFVKGATELKAALTWAAGEEQALAPEITAVENVVNKVVAAVYPGSDVVAAAIEAVFAKALSAVDALGAAASADAVNVELDTAAVNAVKAALPIVKTQAQTQPGS